MIGRFTTRLKSSDDTWAFLLSEYHESVERFCIMTNPSAERERVIFVDVDDTLIRSYGTKRIPIPNAIRYVRDMFETGHRLYCWSRGGENYSREVAIELGIEDCFVGFLPKPDVVVDDRLEGLLAHCEFVHPSNALARIDRGNDRIQLINRSSPTSPEP